MSDFTLKVSISHSVLKKVFVAGLSAVLVSVVFGLVWLSVEWSPLGFFGEIGTGVAAVPSWYFLYLKMLALKVSVSV